MTQPATALLAAVNLSLLIYTEGVVKGSDEWYHKEKVSQANFMSRIDIDSFASCNADATLHSYC